MTFTPEDEYWSNVVYNSLPNWLKFNRFLPPVDGKLNPYVLIRAIAKTISTVAQANQSQVDSLYLFDTFGPDLDFIGFVRGVTRNIINGVTENDDSYRNRIRRFWSPPDSTLLETTLNNNFGVYGHWQVFEIPYVYFALGNPIFGGYLGRNSMLLETDTSVTNINFPTLSRNENLAILVYLTSTSPPSPTVITDDIYPLINKLKTYGVVPYLVIYEPP